ncbi:MAG: hypothetical protein OXC00_03880 [Acidimicrobiaceae bacterium]|nr:hypothetical protein [Acidimicrobiaceae bacterium]
MDPDPILDKLMRTFEKQRAELLVTDEGRWAGFVQPHDKRFRPAFVGCFDDEHEACAAGFGNTIGRRFLIKEVVKEDWVVMSGQVVISDRLL